MPIPIVASLLLGEAIIIIAALFVVYRLQVKPKARTTIATQRRNASGWVYEFIDPDTNLTVYVGQSVNVEKRVDQHIRASMSTGMLDAWLADLMQHGKRPIVRKVAQGNGVIELKRLEQERINELRADGVTLFNRPSKQSTKLHLLYATIVE